MTVPEKVSISQVIESSQIQSQRVFNSVHLVVSGCFFTSTNAFDCHRSDTLASTFCLTLHLVNINTQPSLHQNVLLIRL